MLLEWFQLRDHPPETPSQANFKKKNIKKNYALLLTI